MAVFRVERNRGYTVMSNHHLRNRDLTLKAKGLLSQMLSLPDNWDYTLAGLSHINREKIDAIREAVRELEKAGYIVSGIYHAATASRHIRMTPPIKPPTMKLSATTPTVPERSKPRGISHTNIRRMPKGMPQHSHT